MSVDDIHQRNEKEHAASVLASVRSNHDEAGAWTSGEVLRLIATPVLATILFVGGVYWIRVQLPADTAGQRSASIVQVHLLPRPDVVPIAAEPVSHSTAEAGVSRTETSLKEPDPATSDDPAPVPKAKAFSPADIPPSNVMAVPSSVSAPADSAAIRFQQALLRHVARFQRYPSSARSLHLEGKVDTQFLMSRDGTLLGVWVKTGSGQVLLDKEAIATIRRAQPLPPIPPELPDRLNIHLELMFEPS